MSERKTDYAAIEEFVDDMIRDEFRNTDIRDVRPALERLHSFAKAQLEELTHLVKEVDGEDEASLDIRAKGAMLSRVLRARAKACKTLMHEDWGKI